MGRHITAMVPALSLSETIRKQTVVINSVSKDYSMTGWRLAMLFGEPEICAMAGGWPKRLTNPTTVVIYSY